MVSHTNADLQHFRCRYNRTVRTVYAGVWQNDTHQKQATPRMCGHHHQFHAAASGMQLRPIMFTAVGTPRALRTGDKPTSLGHVNKNSILRAASRCLYRG